jgi:hypothetical protein
MISSQAAQWESHRYKSFSEMQKHAVDGWGGFEGHTPATAGQIWKGI